jgi:hypothetical protein
MISCEPFAACCSDQAALLCCNMLSSYQQQAPSGRSNASQTGATGLAVQPAVVQLKYSENGVDPSTMQDAVKLRNKFKNKREKSNIATVSIYAASRANKGTATRSSSGVGSNFHSERNALGSTMDDASINGFNNADGKATGGALKQGGIVDVDVYTERPPCTEGCSVYFRNLESKIDGDVKVLFSDELEAWDDLGKKQTAAWENHLKKVILDEEIDIDVDLLSTVKKEVVKEKIIKDKLERKESEEIIELEDIVEDLSDVVSTQRIKINEQAIGFQRIFLMEKIFQSCSVNFYEFADNDNPFEEATIIEFEGSAITKSLIESELFAKGFKVD